MPRYKRDISRVESAVKNGIDIQKVFPRLLSITSTATGDGVSFKVSFSKKEGAPVKFVSGDDTQEVAAIREVDLRKKYHLRATELAKLIGLSVPKSNAVRCHLSIDTDKSCTHVFEFGKTKITCFSDNALKRMREALDAGLDVEQVYRDQRNK